MFLEVDVFEGTTLYYENPILSNAAILVYNVINDQDEQLGYLLVTGLKTQSNGAYLIASLVNKRNKAKDAILLFKGEHLIIYELCHCGIFAVSGKMSSAMQSILEEQ